MDKQHIRSVLLDAANEIDGLRNHIAQLRPKADAYDTIARIAGLAGGGQPPEGFSVDVAWGLRRQADMLGDQPEAAKNENPEAPVEDEDQPLFKIHTFSSLGEVLEHLMKSFEVRMAEGEPQPTPPTA